MKLNPVRLKLASTVVSASVTAGDQLKVPAQLDPQTFQQVYQTDIDKGGLSEAKAIALSIAPAKTLPSVHDQMLRHLRS